MWHSVRCSFPFHSTLRLTHLYNFFIIDSLVSNCRGFFSLLETSKVFRTHSRFSECAEFCSDIFTIYRLIGSLNNGMGDGVFCQLSIGHASMLIHSCKKDFIARMTVFFPTWFQSRITRISLDLLCLFLCLYLARSRNELIVYTSSNL